VLHKVAAYVTNPAFRLRKASVLRFQQRLEGSSLRTEILYQPAHLEADALQARADFVVKLTKMQFPALPNDVFSSAFAAAMSEAPTSLCTIKTSPRSIFYEINTTNTFLFNL
jgi:hypothetical protein